MELQQHPYSCGAAALRAILYVMGKNVLEKTIRRVAGTTIEGTDEEGMKKAIEHYKLRHRKFEKHTMPEAIKGLKAELHRGNPMLLAVDKQDHWVSVIGLMGKKILVFDPANWLGRKKKLRGLRVYKISEFMARWAYYDSSDDLTYYYGITVLPGKE